MRKLTIEPITDGFAASVSGINLASVDDDEWERIHEAYLQYAVLLFPAQYLEVEAQKSFALRFGTIEIINGQEGDSPVGNIRPDGTHIKDDTDKQKYGLIKGNELWHIDSSYMPVSANVSMLSAHILPTSGSATEWADMRAAYDALPDDVRERIARLSAFHSIVEAQARMGYAKGTYGFDLDEPPLRPLVKVHPETGRRSLFIGRHAYEIAGLSSEESSTLLEWLHDFACRAPRVYRHEWRMGDLVLWDNRCVLHRATPYDLTERRLMIHTRIKGDPSSEGVSPTNALVS